MKKGTLRRKGERHQADYKEQEENGEKNDPHIRRAQMRQKGGWQRWRRLRNCNGKLNAGSIWGKLWHAGSIWGKLWHS